MAESQLDYNLSSLVLWVCTQVVEVDPKEETELMKQVVQNTWKKADALRDQAVEAAEKRTEERVHTAATFLATAPCITQLPVRPPSSCV